MKKPSDKSPVSIRTIESDLKTIFWGEDRFPVDTSQEHATISLEQAVQLFDKLRAGTSLAGRSSGESSWTHPSVLSLCQQDATEDAISAIISRARRLVLDAMEQGWSGPPYNPFTLAEMTGKKVLPTEEVLDARTHSDSERRYTIEFNPERPAARIRYSIAHELGHTLFPDCAAAIRNRATHQEMRGDDWQLEFLCNMAAAEILMPFGTLQEALSTRPSVGSVLDLRRKYLVSCEAVINRLIRLTPYPCTAFLARRDPTKPRYFIEYNIPSAALHERLSIYRGFMLPPSSRAAECIAIGTTEREEAAWISSGKEWFVEYLGLSPNPGETLPRVLGLAFPPLLLDNSSFADPLTVVKGDASEPFGADPKLLLQVVNDQAQIWGGGFAKQAGKKWPQAQAQFRQWAYGRHNLKLGNIHAATVRPDLTLVSLVAQHGFGRPTSGPRIRYGQLFSALAQVGDLALKSGASVHMPRIGTAEAGGNWNIIEGIIRETLVSRGVKVTIYDLRPPSHDFARQPSFEFPRDMVDEVF